MVVIITIIVITRQGAEGDLMALGFIPADLAVDTVSGKTYLKFGQFFWPCLFPGRCLSRQEQNEGRKEFEQCISKSGWIKV